MTTQALPKMRQEPHEAFPLVTVTFRVRGVPVNAIVWIFFSYFLQSPEDAVQISNEVAGSSSVSNCHRCSTWKFVIVCVTCFLLAAMVTVGVLVAVKLTTDANKEIFRVSFNFIHRIIIDETMNENICSVIRKYIKGQLTPNFNLLPLLWSSPTHLKCSWPRGSKHQTSWSHQSYLAVYALAQDPGTSNLQDSLNNLWCPR